MEQSQKICLVTGAGGFIGGVLCARLQSEGWGVRRFLHERQGTLVLDSPGFGNKRRGNDGGRCGDGDYCGDINEVGVLESAMRGVQVVFHLAGVAHTGGRSAGLYHRANVLGSEAVARAASATGVSRLVFFSSSQVGAAEDGRLPMSAYIASKQEAERLLQKHGVENGLEVCILRPGHVYGAGMKGGIAGMIRMARRGWLPRLPALGGRLSMVGVEDVCRFAMAAAVRSDAVGRVLPVCDGQVYSVNGIERLIREVIDPPPVQRRAAPSLHWLPLKGGAIGVRRRTKDVQGGAIGAAIRCPRVILFIASVVAETMNRIRAGSVGFGLGTYRALVSDQSIDRAAAIAAHELLGFTPQQRFEDFLRGYIHTITPPLRGSR